MSSTADRAVRRLTALGNRVVVGLYRLTGGRMAPRLPGGPPVLLLTVPGRRTGRVRTTPVCFFDLDGGLLVVGSAGGAPHDPQWFRNLRAAGSAQVEVGRDRRQVRARVPERAERDRLWRDVVIARAPAFDAYDRRTERAIPVAVLIPA